MAVIDLRSDTLTVPTPAMRDAMAAAPVGDDVYAEDPSIAALEARTAALLGHEAGLFCVTGSLANLLGVAAHVAPGQEVLCDAGAHIARAEMGAHGALHGVTMRTWVTPDGVAELGQIEQLLAPDAGPYLVSTACVEIENTHNFGGGTIQPLEGLRVTSTLCRDAGVPIIPVAMVNSQVTGSRFGLPWADHPVVRVGEPLDYSRYAALADDFAVIRWITDDVMAHIQDLSGQSYVSAYAQSVKSGSVSPQDAAARVLPRPGHGSTPPPLPERLS